MIRLVAFTIICAALLLDKFALSNEAEKPHIEYVRHFLQLYPVRMEKAIEQMPLIESESEKHGIEPIVPVVIASLESSYRQSATGKRGERGWFQIMPKSVCANGYDIDTIEGNISSGIACIAASRDACDGTLEQTLTMYACGSCRSKSKRTQRLIRRRVRIIERWK